MNKEKTNKQTKCNKTLPAKPTKKDVAFIFTGVGNHVVNPQVSKETLERDRAFKNDPREMLLSIV